MPIVTNDKGEALRLDQTGRWVPTRVVTNDNGDKLALDGNEWKPVPKPEPNTPTDMLRSIPGAIAKGATAMAGLPGEVSNLIGGGMKALGIPTRDMNAPLPAGNLGPAAGGELGGLPPDTATLDAAVSKPFGGYYKPQTEPGKVTETVGSFWPGAVGGGGSLARRALLNVLAPALGSEAGGAAARGGQYEGLAKVAGAVVGGAPAMARAGASGIARALASGVDALPAEDAALVAKYESMGGQLRPGQYHPSNFIRQGDSVVADMPFPRAAGFAADSQHAVLPDAQSDQYHRFVARTFGENAPRITSEVVEKAEKRLGDVWERVLPRNNITTSEPLQQVMGKVETALATAMPAMKPEDVTRMSGVINSIRGQLASGGVSGELYQTYRMRGGLLDELAGSKSPVLQRAAGDIRSALDEAFATQAQGQDGLDLRKAQEQYRNLQVVKPLAAKAPTGKIAPGLLLGAVNSEFNNNPAAAGELGTLAQVGKAFMSSLPNSGTSERGIWRAMVNKPFSEGVPAVMNAALSLPVSVTASRFVNRSINSPEMRAKLLADVLKGKQPQTTIVDPKQLAAMLQAPPAP